MWYTPSVAVAVRFSSVCLDLSFRPLDPQNGGLLDAVVRMMTLRLLAVAPALSAYLLASAPRGSLHHARMSLVDGESVAALPAGLEKEVLRSPLPTAQPCKTGDIALVHFTVAKADGTLLHDSRADEGEPLEFSVGVQPSEVVSRAASSPPALLRRLSQLASAPTTHRPYAAHAPPTPPPTLPPIGTASHARRRLPGARLGPGATRHARGGGGEAALYATQGSNPRPADRAPGRSATHTSEPRLGQAPPSSPTGRRARHR